MLKGGYAQYPVKTKDGNIVGVITKTDLMNKLIKKAVKPSDSIKDVIKKELRHVSATVTLNELNRVLTRNGFVLVEKKYMVTTSDLLSNFCGESSPRVNLNLKDQNSATSECDTPVTQPDSPSEITPCSRPKRLNLRKRALKAARKEAMKNYKVSVSPFLKTTSRKKIVT